eukprot:COSAG01_NODE_13802_length_1533_cov_1.862622_3_plen_122_part_01
MSECASDTANARTTATGETTNQTIKRQSRCGEAGPLRTYPRTLKHARARARRRSRGRWARLVAAAVEMARERTRKLVADARHPDGVDDRGVVELVAHHDVLLAQDGLHRRGVGGYPPAERGR